jgi:hypothetical protein
VKTLTRNDVLIQQKNRPCMQIKWISKDSHRVRYDGFYLVSDGKPAIGPFVSEEDAWAVQNGMSSRIHRGKARNTP